MKKIAHIVSTFWPRPGGMGQVCFEEVKRLAANHDVSVFTLRYHGLNEEEPVAGFTVKRIKPLFRLGDAGMVRGLEKQLADFDVVHVHYPFYGAIQAITAAEKKYGFKLVVTYHMDAQVSGVKKILQSIHDALWDGWLFSLADKVLTPDKEYFALAKFGPRVTAGKIEVLPNGVDTDFFRPGAVDWAKIGLGDLSDKKIILFVGNLLAIKNLNLLIKAMIDLPPEALLVVVGGGYEEKKYRALVRRLGLSERIIFTGGDIDRDRLAQLYRSATAVAIPSLSESFSLVAVEAMASGAIVAGSDIPGIRGRVANNVDGFLFPANDLPAWVAGLKHILNLSADERRIISERARASSLKYSLSEHVKNLERIYSSI
ncbi:MAG: glycosyltransferase family 4 protein [Patescibacteria group bacterium]|nr:glycosyltransferase family 4 protein [Patescibacteria group bacterium]